MKGSTNVEFILSVVLFVIVIAFVSMNIINIQPRLRQEVVLDSLKSEAFRLSDRIVIHELGSRPYLADNKRDFFDKCEDMQLSTYNFEIVMDSNRCTKGTINSQSLKFTVVRNVLDSATIKQISVTVGL